MKHRVELEIGGSTLSFETGELAKQADGSVIVRYGDTVVLATACWRDGAVQGDFMPLTCDYRENTYAGGRIPGGFFKREGRPTEKETLTCRLIDRPLRPSFTPGYRQETQVIAFVLSADGENDPDVLAINGAALALSISEIPFPNPIAAVRIGYRDGEFLVNPNSSERDLSEIDLVVAGTEEAIVMVEAGALEVSESLVLDALEKAHEEIKRIVAVMKELRTAVGNVELEVVAMKKYTPEIYAAISENWSEKLTGAMQTMGKFERSSAVKRVINDAIAEVPEEDADARMAHKAALGDLEKKIFRELVTKTKTRVDGRKPDEIRDITISNSVLPRTHGSSVFTRGETQALVTVTLGTPNEAQKIEDFEGETFQRFMLHYNFPPFSVGEVKFLRGPGRREIGHGNLARRALTPVLPSEDEFAYTIRIVSDILESNGSSSMASVCGGSLAMMDAGVPLRSHVAGVAMGLVKEGDDTVVLTDIAGIEDHEGDMDFKVAGTKDGITALQMDIKIAGVSRDVLTSALEQARQGRLHILGKMDDSINEARTALSAFAPRLHTVNVPKDKIRDIIGPGGKMIRSIVEQTGCKIEVEDDGKVIIASTDEASAAMAIEIIKGLTATAEIGKRYQGTVRRVEPYGAFIEILPGQDGLLHVSEIDHGRVNNVNDYMQLGDSIEVECVDIDSENGKIRLSRKPLLPPPTEEQLEAEKKARESRESRGPRPGGDRGGRGGGGGRSGGGGGRGPRRG